MAKNLPINSRIIEQLSKATIKNLIDGVVELVTNSDDSYRRLELAGKSTEGIIEVFIKRKKGGYCELLRVKDWAEGMSKTELESAIEFAGETSGFKEGRSVRGFFGRGLKETILALGEGKIVTIKNGKKHQTRIFISKNRPVYDELMLSKCEETREPNGTEVTVIVTNQKMRLPKYSTFKRQLANHYALRYINSSKKRKVWLIFEDVQRGEKNTIPIKFDFPPAKKVFQETLRLPDYGDEVALSIYESDEMLDSPRANPYGLAGILIISECTILDNQLFRFENEIAAHYFYGFAKCDEINNRLRDGEFGIIDPNRGGLEWKHPYCQALAKLIEKTLEPFVVEKRRLLQKGSQREISENKKNLLRKLCRKLNELAKYELEDEMFVQEISSEYVGKGPVQELLIKPEKANLELNKARIFTIYAPDLLVETYGNTVKVESSSSAFAIYPVFVELKKHQNYLGTWVGEFDVVCSKDVEGSIKAVLGDEEAVAWLKVAPPGKKVKGKLSVRKGGFVSDILPDEMEDPPQRVSYEDGVIKIYVRFPSVAKFIGSAFEGSETPEGKLLIAELVGEAFCAALARRGFEIGKYPKIPGSEIDSYNNVINELKKKYLHIIQEVVFLWKFRED